MIFGREPSVWLGLLQAIVSAVVILGWWHLSPDESGAILAVAAAVAAAVLAFHVHPFPPVAITHLLTACVALVAAFKFHIRSDQLASLVLIVQMAVAVATRQSVVPVPPAESPALRRRKIAA